MMRRIAALLTVAGALMLSGCVLPPPLPSAAPAPTAAVPIEPVTSASPTTAPSPAPSPSATPSQTAEPAPSVPQPSVEECQSIDEQTAAFINRSNGFLEADPGDGNIDWAAMEQTSTDLHAMLAALRAEVTHPDVLAGIDDTSLKLDDVDAAIADRDDLAVLLRQTTMTLATVGIVAPCQGLL